MHGPTAPSASIPSSILMHDHPSPICADLPLRDRAARVSRFVGRFASTKDAALALGIPIYVLQYHRFALVKLDEDLGRTEAAIARLERGASPISGGAGARAEGAAAGSTLEGAGGDEGGGR